MTGDSTRSSDRENAELSRLRAETEKFKAEAARARQEQQEASKPLWRSRRSAQVIAGVLLLGPLVFFYIKEIAVPLYHKESVELALDLALQERDFEDQATTLALRIQKINNSYEKLLLEEGQLQIERQALREERDALSERVDALQAEYSSLARDKSLAESSRASYEARANSLKTELEEFRANALSESQRRTATEQQCQEALAQLRSEAAAAGLVLGRTIMAPPNRPSWGRLLENTGSGRQLKDGDVFRYEHTCCIYCNGSFVCGFQITGSCGSCSVD